MQTAPKWIASLLSIGAAHIPGAIAEDERRLLIEAVEDLALERSPPRVGVVEQAVDGVVLEGAQVDRHQTLGPFVRRESRRLRDQAPALLGGWAPNEATILRYRRAGDHIGPILTVAGTCS